MHDAWSKDKKNSKDGCYRNKASSTTTTDATKSMASAPKNTLGLTDRLKQVLMTNVCLSAEDVEKLFNEAQANEAQEN